MPDSRVSRPVRVVASGTGGGNNLVARLLAQGLTEALSRPVTVENRSAKYEAAGRVARAQPDGRSILLYGSGLWYAPLIDDQVPYDPLRDFSPVTLAARSPNVLVVHASVPVSSVAELLALTRARPGEIRCGYSVPGGSPHLAAQLFKALANVAIETVAYPNVEAVFADLSAGKLQMMFPNAAAAKLHLDSSSLKALAVTSAVPSEQFPGLPTVQASVPGYVSEAVFALLAPARTPARVVRKLQRAVAEVLTTREVREQILAAGLEVAATTPQDLAATIRDDMRRMARIFAEIRA